MTTILLPSLRLLVVLMMLTGVLYPWVISLVARAAFPHRAGGSLVTRDGKVIGSELLAQRFTNAAFFWPRPSATEYATVPSGASNQGPTSRDLRNNVLTRAVAFRSANGLAPNAAVPSEMLFASGSGVDPHVSPEAARQQIGRIAKARNLSPERQQRLATLVTQFIEPPQLGFLGEPRVNILLFNLVLEKLE